MLVYKRPIRLQEFLIRYICIACTIQMSHCSMCQHRSQDGGHAWTLFIDVLGEQNVRGKDSILQVNLTKKVVARTVNN